EDMVEVVRTAMFMERVRRADGRRPTPEQALTWATRNGYRALGAPDGGWIAPGNRADFIVVDFRRAHLTPALRPVACFVHQGRAGHRRRGPARGPRGVGAVVRRAAGAAAPARLRALGTGPGHSTIAA